MLLWPHCHPPLPCLDPSQPSTSSHTNSVAHGDDDDGHDDDDGDDDEVEADKDGD